MIPLKVEVPSRPCSLSHPAFLGRSGSLHLAYRPLRKTKAQSCCRTSLVKATLTVRQRLNQHHLAVHAPSSEVRTLPADPRLRPQQSSRRQNFKSVPFVLKLQTQASTWYPCRRADDTCHCVPLPCSSSSLASVFSVLSRSKREMGPESHGGLTLALRPCGLAFTASKDNTLLR